MFFKLRSQKKGSCLISCFNVYNKVTFLQATMKNKPRHGLNSKKNIFSFNHTTNRSFSRPITQKNLNAP